MVGRRYVLVIPESCTHVSVDHIQDSSNGELNDAECDAVTLYFAHDFAQESCA